MSTREEIIKQKQIIARQEKLLAQEKLKKRRADTRRKIELGGLVIKSGMDGFNKAIILGGLDHIFKLIEQETSYKALFENTGNTLFLSSNL